MSKNFIGIIGGEDRPLTEVEKLRLKQAVLDSLHNKVGYYTNGPAEYSGWFVAMCSIICLGVGVFAGWLITYLGQQ